MPSGRDPDGAWWTVRRVWWPYGSWLSEMDGAELLFALGLIATAPLVVIWPFWLLTRLAGQPWTLIVRRMGQEVHREKVSGWTESGQRMAALIEEARSGGGPDLPKGAIVY
ncbi:MAG TPA: hypothetical protein PLH92_01125 [Mycobacterium sp.]|uniref:hypothetical protein n=1 Tax=Mycolicibacterium sp. TaxID=2320850 RepID=UPI0025D6E713|nr:hypothetical protein [Mycolicibacterium sp.]HPX35367.1 hypothetical protein [Mycobacterium sp.]HQC75306.1 hypothetical protein [Mycobacterium sp.]